MLDSYFKMCLIRIVLFAFGCKVSFMNKLYYRYRRAVVFRFSISLSVGRARQVNEQSTTRAISRRLPCKRGNEALAAEASALIRPLNYPGSM